MPMRVALNGFGRIGRLVFRHLMEREKSTETDHSDSDRSDHIDVVAVNDIAPLDNLIYLLRHDSVHRAPTARIEMTDVESIRWNDREIQFLSQRDPSDLPWHDLEVDTVLEASGIFTARDDAARHLEAGADRVIVTAPSKGADITICMGVNEDRLDTDQHTIISNASCTTNCLAPVANVLDEAMGIESGLLTTIHAYTSSQALVDAPSRKWRRGRAAALSVVPTTTGAALATTQVLPGLEGKLDGMAMRVPVASGSVIDFVIQSEQPTDVDSVNEAFRRAARSERLEGILGVAEEPLVSADIIGSPYSALVDATSTMVVRGHTVKVVAWYDNEWAYARRVVDLAAFLAVELGSRVGSASGA